MSKDEQLEFVDSVVELFHPDMNYSDIIGAIKNITATVRGNSEVLWADRKTQLEIDQAAASLAGLTGAQKQILRLGALFERGTSFDAIIDEIKRLLAADKNIQRLGAAPFGTKFNEAMERALKEPTLVDALSWMATRCNEFAVRQALRNVGPANRDANGALWETTFKYDFTELLRNWGIAPECPKGAVAAAPQEPKPFPILLYCPLCHTKHVDEGEFATKPHHTHSCQGFVTDSAGKRRRCGHSWRPAKGPTVGIEHIEGFVNPPTGEELVGKRVRVLNHEPMAGATDTGIVARFDGPYFNKSEERYHVVMGVYELNLKREEFETL